MANYKHGSKKRFRTTQEMRDRRQAMAKQRAKLVKSTKSELKKLDDAIAQEEDRSDWGLF